MTAGRGAAGLLIGLRVIYWLRRRKTTDVGFDIPATSMAGVRRALAELQSLNVPLWKNDRPTLFVDGEGRVYLQGPRGLQTAEGQLAHGDVLDLIAPFTTSEGLRGPDLAQPRPELRIIPGKLGGSPHVAHTRLETRAIAALAEEGHEPDGILRFYPFLTRAQVEQAIDLEGQLTANLAVPVAA